MPAILNPAHTSPASSAWPQAGATNARPYPPPIDSRTKPGTVSNTWTSEPAHNEVPYSRGEIELAEWLVANAGLPKLITVADVLKMGLSRMHSLKAEADQRRAFNAYCINAEMLRNER